VKKTEKWGISLFMINLTMCILFSCKPDLSMSIWVALNITSGIVVVIGGVLFLSE